jgi:uncharacterized protein HemX
MTYPGQGPHFDPTLVGGQPPLVYGQVPPGAPPKSGKKTGIVVLSIVAVLLLAAAGAFGGLYFSAKKDHDAVTSQLSAKEKALTDSAKQLQDAKDQATKAQDAKTTAENKNTQMAKCYDAGHALAAAGLAQDASKIDQLGVNLVLACG